MIVLYLKKCLTSPLSKFVFSYGILCIYDLSSLTPQITFISVTVQTPLNTLHLLIIYLLSYLIYKLIITIIIKCEFHLKKTEN